jgi:hypothetical protein
MPLRLARYGVPLAETAPAGLAAAGIEPALIPPAPQQPQLAAATPVPQRPAAPVAAQEAESDQNPWLHARDPQSVRYQGGYDPNYDPDAAYAQWYEEQRQAEEYEDQYQEEPDPLPAPEDTGSFPIPVVPGRTRELGEGGGTPEPDEEAYYQVFRQSIDGSFPTPGVLGDNIEATYGTKLTPGELKAMSDRFQRRFNVELEENHIA